MRWFFWKSNVILDSTLQAIMGRAAAHCLDDQALLDRSRHWLAERAGTSVRTLERREPTLAKLNLLVKADHGYRLPLFFEYDRQNGGPFLAKLTANLSEKEERTKEEKEICVKVLESPPTPQGGRRLTRAERKALAEAETLARYRSLPRAHWPQGLDGPWQPVKDWCFIAKHDYICVNERCPFEHDNTMELACTPCLETGRNGAIHLIPARGGDNARR